MKRIISIICAMVLTGASLSAQSMQEGIKVCKEGDNTILIINTDKDISKRDLRRVQRTVNRIERDTYMMNVGYLRGYRADVELGWDSSKSWGISTSHGFSFGNGLYIGGGAGFGAVLTRKSSDTRATDAEVGTEQTYTPENNWDATYSIPMFADVKYSFMKSFVAPFIDIRGGAIADISNSGAALFINPAIGVDIARFSVKVGYERQLGCWGSQKGVKANNVKLSVAYTF